MSADLATFVEARENVLQAALHVLVTERGLSDEVASVTALNAAEDALVLAARDLTRAVETLPYPRRPKGWRETDS